MKKIVCFVPGFESFGIFVGCLLADRDEPNKIRKTTEFYNLVLSHRFSRDSRSIMVVLV